MEMKFTNKRKAEAFVYTIEKNGYRVTDTVEANGLYTVTYDKIKTRAKRQGGGAFPFLLNLILLPLDLLKEIDEFLIQETHYTLSTPIFSSAIVLTGVLMLFHGSSRLIIIAIGGVILYNLRLWYIIWSRNLALNQKTVEWRHEQPTHPPTKT